MSPHEHAMQIILEKVNFFFWNSGHFKYVISGIMQHNVLLHSKPMNIKPNKALFSETKHKLSKSELFVIYSVFAYFTNVY